MEIKQLETVDLLKTSPEKKHVPKEGCTQLNQCEPPYTSRTREHPALLPFLKPHRSDFLTEHPEHHQTTWAVLCCSSVTVQRRIQVALSQIFLLASQANYHATTCEEQS